MEDAVSAIIKLKKEEFLLSASAPAPSQLVVLAQRVVCLMLSISTPNPVLSFSSSSVPELTRHVSQVYKKLVHEMWVDENGWSIPLQLACLDTLMLAAMLQDEISELMSAFTALVADDDFLVDNELDEPLAQWAVVICLWLRRLAQVCSACGPSMATSYAESILKHSKNQLQASLLQLERWKRSIQMRQCKQLSEQHPAGGFDWSGSGPFQLVVANDNGIDRRSSSQQFIDGWLSSGFGDPSNLGTNSERESTLASTMNREGVPLACNRLLHERGVLDMPQVG